MTTQGLSVYQNTLTPATPAANYRVLFPKADGWHDLDSAGVDHLLLAPDSNGVVGVTKPGQNPGLFLTSISNTSAVLSGGAYWNGSTFVATAGATTAGTVNLNAASGVQFSFDTGLTPAATFTPTTRLTLGATAITTAVPLYVYKVDDLAGGPAVLYLSHNPLTVTPGAGYGVSLQFQAKTDTTVDTALLLIQTTWATATHASRKARVDFYTYDTSARLCLRMEASGSAAMLGFYGSAAIAKQTGVAVTAAAIHAALVNLGLIGA